MASACARQPPPGAASGDAPRPRPRPTRASALREALLVSRPVVNLAQTGPGSWAGADSTGTYTVSCLRTGGDWVVSATRDKGSGARRLTPDEHHAKRAEATRCVRDTLEAVATTGRAAKG